MPYVVIYDFYIYTEQVFSSTGQHGHVTSLDGGGQQTDNCESAQCTVCVCVGVRGCARVCVCACVCVWLVKAFDVLYVMTRPLRSTCAHLFLPPINSRLLICPVSFFFCTSPTASSAVGKMLTKQLSLDKFD